jgi:hypothetical protein
VRFPLEMLGKQIMAVFVDIYGNEARELIPATQFGATTNNSAKTAKGKKVRRKQQKA